MPRVSSRERELSLFMILKRRLIVLRIAAVVCFVFFFLLELNFSSCVTELDFNIKTVKCGINWTVK